MDKNFSAILGVALILIVLISGVINTVKTKINQTPNENYSLSETSILYKDKTNGYSIYYPKDFSMIETDDTKTFDIPIKNYFNTILANEARLTISKPSSKCPQSEGDQIVSAGEIKSGDIVFKKDNWSGVGAGQLYVGADYTTLKNGLCYSIHIFTHSTNGAGFYIDDPVEIKKIDDEHAADMKKFLEAIDGIVSTFKFL
ncbi:MAG: hypothetical protein WCW87_03105 [Candidatus Paceibacterota bacterium]